MTTVGETPEANAIATIVADRCHGNRKPNQGRERYAVIWQAARLGALEAMKQPALAGIENPAAFVQAARGMAEALNHIDALCPVNASGCSHAALSGLLYNIEVHAQAALTAFRAATGEQA